MAAELIFACVYRPGGGFSDEYVYRLQRAVAKFCRLPHRFVCLTNQNLKGMEVVPFVRNWPGYWSKIELFRPGLFDGPVRYFDLDTAFLSDITDIVEAHYAFACGTSWKHGGGNDNYMNSAVMMWDSRIDLSHIYEQFTAGVIPKYEQSWQRWGDQGFIQDHLGRPFESLLTRWPNRILHSKTNVWGPTKNLMAVPYGGASIVCFSGRPRPHQLPPDSPLYKHWMN